MTIEKTNDSLGYVVVYSLLTKKEATATSYGISVTKKSFGGQTEVVEKENITPSYIEAFLLLHLLCACDVTPVGLDDTLEYLYDYAASV